MATRRSYHYISGAGEKERVAELIRVYRLAHSGVGDHDDLNPMIDGLTADGWIIIYIDTSQTGSFPLRYDYLASYTGSTGDEVWFTGDAAGREYTFNAKGNQDEYIIARSFSWAVDNDPATGPETGDGSDTKVTISDGSGGNIFRFLQGVRISAAVYNGGDTLEISFGNSNHRTLFIRHAADSTYKIGPGNRLTDRTGSNANDAAAELTLGEFLAHVHEILRTKTYYQIGGNLTANHLATLSHLQDVDAIPHVAYESFITYIPDYTSGQNTNTERDSLINNLYRQLYRDDDLAAIFSSGNRLFAAGTSASDDAYWAYVSRLTTGDNVGRWQIGELQASHKNADKPDAVWLVGSTTGATRSVSAGEGVDQYFIAQGFSENAGETSTNVTIDDSGENIYRFREQVKISDASVNNDGDLLISFGSSDHKSLTIESAIHGRYIIGTNSRTELTAKEFLALVNDASPEAPYVVSGDLGAGDVPAPLEIDIVDPFAPVTSLFYWRSTPSLFNQHNFLRNSNKLSVGDSTIPNDLRVEASSDSANWYYVTYDPLGDRLTAHHRPNGRSGNDAVDRIWFFSQLEGQRTTVSGDGGVDTYTIASSFSAAAAGHGGTNVTIDDSGENIYRFRTGVKIKSATSEGSGARKLKLIFGETSTHVALTINNADAGLFRLGNDNDTTFTLAEFVEFIRLKTASGAYTVVNDLDDNDIPDISPIGFTEAPGADKAVSIDYTANPKAVDANAGGTLTATVREGASVTLTPPVTHNGDAATYGTFTYTPNAQNTGGAWTYVIDPADRDILRLTPQTISEVITFTATDSDNMPWTHDLAIEFTVTGAADRDLTVRDLYSGQATVIIHGVLFTVNDRVVGGNNIHIDVQKGEANAINLDDGDYTITLAEDEVVTPELLEELWTESGQQTDITTRNRRISVESVDPDIADATRDQIVGRYIFRGGSDTNDETQDDKSVVLNWGADDMAAGDALEASGRLYINDPDDGASGSTVAVASDAAYGTFSIPTRGTGTNSATFGWTYTIDHTDEATRALVGMGDDAVKASVILSGLEFTAKTPGTAGNNLKILIRVSPGESDLSIRTTRIKHSLEDDLITIDVHIGDHNYPTLQRIINDIAAHDTARTAVDVALQTSGTGGNKLMTPGQSNVSGGTTLGEANLTGGVDASTTTHDIITLKVSDASGGVSFHDIPIDVTIRGELREVSFTVGTGNDAQTHTQSGVRTQSDKMLTENTAYEAETILENITATLSGAGGGAAPIALDETSRALGFAYDSSSGNITFTGSLNFEALTDADTTANGLQHPITLTATRSGISTTHQVLVTIANVGELPIPEQPFPNIPITAIIGEAWEYTPPAFVSLENDDITAHAVSLANGDDLPQWLEYNANTRTFSIAKGESPTAEGEYTIIMTATSGTGSSALESAPQAFTIHLAPLLHVTPQPNPGRATGSVVDSDGDAVFEAYAVALGTRGEGLTISMVEDRAIGFRTEGGVKKSLFVFEVSGTAIIARYNPIDYTDTTVSDFIAAARADGAISPLIRLNLADGVADDRSLTGLATQGFMPAMEATPLTPATPLDPGDDVATLTLQRPSGEVPPDPLPEMPFIDVHGVRFTLLKPGEVGTLGIVVRRLLFTRTDGVKLQNTEEAKTHNLRYYVSLGNDQYYTPRRLLNLWNTKTTSDPTIRTERIRADLITSLDLTATSPGSKSSTAIADEGGGFFPTSRYDPFIEFFGLRFTIISEGSPPATIIKFVEAADAEASLGNVKTSSVTLSSGAYEIAIRNPDSTNTITPENIITAWNSGREEADVARRLSIRLEKIEGTNPTPLLFDDLVALEEYGGGIDLAHAAPEDTSLPQGFSRTPIPPGAPTIPETASLDAGGLRFTAKEAGARGNSFKVEAKAVASMTIANDDVGFVWDADTKTLTIALPASAANYPTLDKTVMEFNSSAPGGAKNAIAVATAPGGSATDITAFSLINLNGGVTPVPAGRPSLEFHGAYFTPVTDDHGMIGIKFARKGSGSGFTPSVEIDDQGFYVINIRPKTGSGSNDKITPQEIIDAWYSGVTLADDARRGHILATLANGTPPESLRFNDLVGLLEYSGREAIIFNDALLLSERYLVADEPRPPIGVIGTDRDDDLTPPPDNENRTFIVFGQERDDTITLTTGAGATQEEIIYRVGEDADDGEDEVTGFTLGQDKVTFIVAPAAAGHAATTLADLLGGSGFDKVSLDYRSGSNGGYRGIKFVSESGQELAITFAEILDAAAIKAIFGVTTDAAFNALFEDDAPTGNGDAELSTAGRALDKITALFGGEEFIKVSEYIPAYETPAAAITLAYGGSGALNPAATNLETHGYRFIAPSVVGGTITHDGDDATYGTFAYHGGSARWTYRLEADDPDTAALMEGAATETITFTVTDIEGATYTEDLEIDITVTGTAQWLANANTSIRDTTPDAMAFVEIHGVRFTRLLDDDATGAEGIEIRTGAVSTVGLTDMGMRYFIALTAGREVTAQTLKDLWDNHMGSEAGAHVAHATRLAAIRAEFITAIDAGASDPAATIATELDGVEAYFPGFLPTRPSVEVGGVRFTWISPETIPAGFQIRFKEKASDNEHGVFHDAAAGAFYDIIIDEVVDDDFTPQDVVLLWNSDTTEGASNTGGRANRIGQIHASLIDADARAIDWAVSGDNDDGVHMLAIPTGGDVPDQPEVDGSVTLNHHDSGYSILRTFGRLTITDTNGIGSITNTDARHGTFSFDKSTGLWAYTLNPLDADTLGLVEGDETETITFTVTDAATPASTPATHSLNININVVGTSEVLFSEATTFTEIDSSGATVPGRMGAYEIIIHGVRFTYQGTDAIPDGFQFRVEAGEGSEVRQDGDNWILQINAGDNAGAGADTDFTPADLEALWKTNEDGHDPASDRTELVLAEVISPGLGGIDLSDGAAAGGLTGDYIFKQRPNHIVTIDLEDSTNNVTEINGRLSITDLDEIASITHDGDTAAKYGTFTFVESTGAWTYMLNLQNSTIASLSQRARLIETITFTVVDMATPKPITTTYAFEIGIEAVAEGTPITPSHFPTTLTATEGMAESFTIPEFAHIDGAQLTYTMTVAGTAPGWLTLGASGTNAAARTLSVGATTDDVDVGLGNAITINVAVSDGPLGDAETNTTEETIQLVVANVNEPPTTSNPTQTITVTRGADAVTIGADYFPFMDPDTGDVLQEVIIVSIEDGLRLLHDGTEVEEGDGIPIQDILNDLLKIGATFAANQSRVTGGFTFRVSDGMLESTGTPGSVDVEVLGIEFDSPIILQATPRITLDADMPLILTVEHLTIHDPDTQGIDTSTATFTLKSADNITVEVNKGTDAVPDWEEVTTGSGSNTFTQQQITDGKIRITAMNDAMFFTISGMHDEAIFEDKKINITISSTIVDEASGADKEVRLNHENPGNTNREASGTFTLTDVDGLNNVNIVVSGVEHGMFTWTEDDDPNTPATYNWEYELRESVGFSGRRTETIELTITDDAGNNTTHGIRISIEVIGEVSAAPVFTSDSSAKIAEDHDLAEAVYTAVATDANDDDTIAYSLKEGVEDADLFMIDSDDGEVRFRVAEPGGDPHMINFATKSFYNFTVIATSGADKLTVEQTVTLSVARPDDAKSSVPTNIPVNEDAPYTFKAIDFGYDSNPNDIPSGSQIEITGLPPRLDGVLIVGGRLASVGDIITIDDLTTNNAAGSFVFEAVRHRTKTFPTSFTYRATDGTEMRDEATLTLTVVADDDEVGFFTTRTQIGMEVSTRPHVFSLADMNVADLDTPGRDTSGAVFTLKETTGGVVQLFDGTVWNDLADDSIFTQQQVIDGHVRLVATEAMGTLKIEAAFGGIDLPEGEQAITFRARLPQKVGGDEVGGADGLLDLSDDNTPRVITTGLGANKIKPGGGNDRVDPGLGDDEVDLSARGDDVVIYRYRKVERPLLDENDDPVTDDNGTPQTTAVTVAWDGGDEITGFEPGADRILLQAFGGTRQGAFIDDLGTGFIATIRTAYREGEGGSAGGDRGNLSSYNVTGIEIHFSEAVLLPGGVLSGSVLTILFEIPSTWDDFNARWLNGNVGNAAFWTSSLQFRDNADGKAALQAILGLGQADVVEARLTPPRGMGTPGDDRITTATDFRGDVLVFGMEGNDTITLGKAVENIVWRLGWDSVNSSSTDMDGDDVVNNFTLGTDRLTFVQSGGNSLTVLLNGLGSVAFDFNGTHYNGVIFSVVNDTLQINFAAQLTAAQLMERMGLNETDFNALFAGGAAPTQATNSADFASTKRSEITKLFGSGFITLATTIPEPVVQVETLPQIRSVVVGDGRDNIISTADESGAWVIYGGKGDDIITLGATGEIPSGANGNNGGNSAPQITAEPEEIVYRLTYDMGEDPGERITGHDGNDTINSFDLGTDRLTFVSPAAKGKASLNNDTFIIKTIEATASLNGFEITIMEGSGLDIAYTAPGGGNAGSLIITIDPDPDNDPNTDDATTYQDILNEYADDVDRSTQTYSADVEFIIPQNARATTPESDGDAIEGGVTSAGLPALLMQEFSEIALDYNPINGYTAIIFEILEDGSTATGGGTNAPVTVRVNFTEDSRLTNTILMNRLGLADDTTAVNALFADGSRPTTSGEEALSTTGIGYLDEIFGAGNITADSTLPVELL